MSRLEHSELVLGPFENLKNSIPDPLVALVALVVVVVGVMVVVVVVVVVWQGQGWWQLRCWWY